MSVVQHVSVSTCCYTSAGLHSCNGLYGVAAVNNRETALTSKRGIAQLFEQDSCYLLYPIYELQGGVLWPNRLCKSFKEKAL